MMHFRAAARSDSDLGLFKSSLIPGAVPVPYLLEQFCCLVSHRNVPLGGKCVQEPIVLNNNTIVIMIIIIILGHNLALLVDYTCYLH